MPEPEKKLPLGLPKPAGDPPETPPPESLSPSPPATNNKFKTEAERDEWLETQMGSLSQQVETLSSSIPTQIAEATKPFSTLLTGLESLTTLLKTKEAPPSPIPPKPLNAGADDPQDRQTPPAPNQKRRKEDQAGVPPPEPKTPTAKKAKIRYL